MTQIIKRDLFDELVAHLPKKEATVLIGPRQAGKTTLIMSLRDHLIREGNVSERHIFYFNLDRFSDLDFFSSQEATIQFLKSKIGSDRIYLFVDEAQRVKEAGLFFKGIYDLDLPVKLILTGSSSLEIKSKFIEPLTGRKRLFHLYPFSFHEFLSAKNPELRHILEQFSPLSLYEKRALNVLFDEFVIFGGYPQVVLSEQEEDKKKILEEIYNSYIEKDIIAFLQIKKPFSFKKLINLLAYQTGQLMNVHELSVPLAIERKTIEQYLHILTETFIITMISPFFTNRRKELIKMPKVYFWDLGLRNFAINNLHKISERNDQGQLLENFIINELCKFPVFTKHIYFWRTHHGAEVDFVLGNGNTLFPIESKWQTKNKIIPIGLRNFIEQYKPMKACIVNMNSDMEIKYDKTTIFFVTPFTFLKQIIVE